MKDREDMDRSVKITFGEMRDMSVRRADLLHGLSMLALDRDQRPDELHGRRLFLISNGSELNHAR